jgi:glyoxylase-like metal-dependent hydrolase (beta-lactamase superfamily II)
LETGGRGLLVDAGFSFRRLQGLLVRIGRDLSNVSAVLLTHGHADHTSGVRSLLRECEVPVYAAPGVAQAVKGATVVEAGEALNLPGGASATFFEVPHDAPTYGLRVSYAGRVCSLVTDLGGRTQWFWRPTTIPIGSGTGHIRRTLSGGWPRR